MDNIGIVKRLLMGPIKRKEPLTPCKKGPIIRCENCEFYEERHAGTTAYAVCNRDMDIKDPGSLCINYDGKVKI